jgi:hypothetical protein
MAQGRRGPLVFFTGRCGKAVADNRFSSFFITLESDTYCPVFFAEAAELSPRWMNRACSCRSCAVRRIASSTNEDRDSPSRSTFRTFRRSSGSTLSVGWKLSSK